MRQSRTMQTQEKPFVPVRFAVLTVSDSRSPEEDRSGATLAERIAAAGHELVDRTIVPDDKRKTPMHPIQPYITTKKHSSS